MRNQIIWVIDGEKGHVRMAVKMICARSDDCLGLRHDEVVHDGQVVRGEIPDYVAVMLKQSKVYAGGIVVVERSQGAVIDKLLDPFHGAGEKERVVDHDLQVLALGQLNQLFGLRRGTGEWFLDKYMLSVLERELCKLKVGPNGRDDRHHVHLCAGQYFHLIGGHRHFRVSATHSRERLGIFVADRNNIGLFVTLKIANDVGTPITVTDYAHADHIAGEACA